MMHLEPIFVPAPANHALNYVCFAPALILAVLMLVNFLFTGLASKVTKDEDREWWGRSAAWIFITIFGWIVFNVIVLWGAQAITDDDGESAGCLSRPGEGESSRQGPPRCVRGSDRHRRRVAGSSIQAKQQAWPKKGLPVASGCSGGRFFCAPVGSNFLGFIGDKLAAWGSRDHNAVSTGMWGRHGTANDSSLSSFSTGITLLFGIVMGFFINANTFSLHATYRNRLIRAYLAASRTAKRRVSSIYLPGLTRTMILSYTSCRPKSLFM